MVHILIQELTTPRLHLRKLRMDDLPYYYSRLASSEVVTRYMLWNPHTSIDDSVASIQKVLRGYEAGTSCRWAIVLKDTGTLIGIIDLLPQDLEAGIYSFAYMLWEEIWNQGYGTEALQAVIDFAFQQCGAQNIEADHFTDNPASGVVMTKAGMQYQKQISGKYQKNGIIHDAKCYCLTREQWLALQ